MHIACEIIYFYIYRPFINIVDNKRIHNMSSISSASSSNYRMKPPQQREERASQDSSALSQIIEYEVNKRLAPLVKRIQYLQNQLILRGPPRPSLNSSQHNMQGSSFGEDIQQGSHNSTQNEILGCDEIKGEMKEDYKVEVCKNEDISIFYTRQSPFSIQDAHLLSAKLDQIAVHPKKMFKWKHYCKLMKKIFIKRARRNSKAVEAQEQQIIVKFVLFCHEVGLYKRQAIALAGVSQSSFYGWLKVFKRKGYLA